MRGVSYFLCHFQSALNINPAALRPGAAPPGQQQIEKAVTFEEPPKAETLTSMTKVSRETHIDTALCNAFFICV